MQNARVDGDLAAVGISRNSGGGSATLFFGDAASEATLHRVSPKRAANVGELQTVPKHRVEFELAIAAKIVPIVDAR